jgi:hypothetical protein
MIRAAIWTDVSSLQGDAWAAWNASYHEGNPEAYQALARALYRQDVHERIAAQLARLDEQNALLDALLEEHRRREGATPAGELAEVG